MYYINLFLYKENNYIILMKYITELSDIINIVNESEKINEEAIFESENISVNNIKRFILSKSKFNFFL